MKQVSDDQLRQLKHYGVQNPSGYMITQEEMENRNRHILNNYPFGALTT